MPKTRSIGRNAAAPAKQPAPSATLGFFLGDCHQGIV
jgi:hypothetical protein